MFNRIIEFTALTLLIALAGCSTQKEAEVVDNKDKYFSRTGGGAPSRQIVVAMGENIDSISRKYNVSQSELMRLNKLVSPQDVREGKRLLIPANSQASNITVTESKTSGYRPGDKESAAGYFYTKKTTRTDRTFEGKVEDDNRHPATSWEKDQEIVENKLAEIQPLKMPKDTGIDASQAGSTEKPVEPDSAEKNRSTEIEEEEARLVTEAKVSKNYKTPSPLNLKDFQWPIQGKIVTRYGSNGKKFNDGLNIASPAGTPIVAAANGKVAYIGKNVEGYGNLVILKHDNNLMTAYAHLDEIAVDRGAQVKKGESIGTVGKSGNVTQPQLHFSVRKGKKTVNPESNG